MNPLYPSLAALGAREAIILLGVGALVIGTAVVVTFLVIALWTRTRRNPPAPNTAANTTRGPTCSRCGNALPTRAPHGLCPRCLMQAGLQTEEATEPAFRDASGKPNPPDPAELARHFPQLEILELLGQGGMGAVYKARQKDLDRLVALKILPGGARSDPAFAERFTREARALGRLNHPNIVAVHDFGEVRSDPANDRSSALLYYFIMEFVDGPDLRELLQRQRLSPAEAMTMVPKICEALQFAHDEGIVHRDIKPENILIDTKGRVKIADFGIAKIAGPRGDATLTGARDVIGTPHYMAPEQVERPAEVDHRADIYSLGVVFYEMLTGELPLGKFEAPSHKVRMDIRLDDVVLRSLAKAPERRYQRAAEVKTAVETINSHDGAAHEESDHDVADDAPKPNQSGQPDSSESRLSRMAVAGACWAPFAFFIFLAGFVAFLPTTVTFTPGGRPPGPTVWQIGLMVIFLPLGLSAPFGATLCGVVALSQIRRSAGRLCGLGLALFDALLFPLIVMNALLVWLVYLLMCQILEWVGFASGTEIPIEQTLLPSALLILVVNVWLVRWAWRSAKRMTGRLPTDDDRQRSSTWVGVALPISAFVLLGVAALMAVPPLQAKRLRERVASTLEQTEVSELAAANNASQSEGVSSALPPAQTPSNLPPVVVSTVPASGTTDVDPTRTELRIAFSHPMRAANWSWVKLDDQTFPEVTGEARYLADARTCVLPVKLEPGRTYAIWINSGDFQNFVSANGTPSVPYLFTFKTKE